MKKVEEILNKHIPLMQILPMPNIEGIYGAMLEYAEQFKQKWIDVKDRMPENREWVLVISSKEIYVANYKNDLFYDGLDVVYCPTKWMPLPEI